MDEIWERAVEAALDGQKDVYAVRSLTLDGAVKCLHGRLPQPALFEKFHNLQHFSVANIGVSSLEQFPRLRNLQRLILSDNRIAGGLEFLVDAGLGSLRDLDLSNNRISDINDLRPLAELRLVSLDLYECPVTRIKDYRAQVFGLIRSLKYLDKMDVDENERPESEDEEEDDEEEEEYDPGSGEVDGEDHPFRLNNGEQAGMEGVLDVDEDEESDADEEETEIPSVVNGSGSRDSHPHSNGFEVVAVDEEEDDDEGEEDDDLVDEVYEDDEGEDEDVVEVHEIDDSEDEDGVEYDEDEDEDEDEEEEVNNDNRDHAEVGGTGRLTSTEGEIDAHEQGEDDVDEDDDGETGEEEQAVEEDGDDDDDDDEEDDYGNGYLLQPVGRAEPQTGGSDMDPEDEDEDPEIEEDLEEEDDEEDLDGEIQELPSSSSHKRKRNENSHDDDDCEDEGEEEDDDVLPYSKSSKHQ